MVLLHRLLRSSKHVEEPRQAHIHHCDLGGDGVQPEATQRKRRFQLHDSEARRVQGNKPSRQRGDQVGVGNDGESEHEIRNGQRNPPRAALLCKNAIDEAIGIACERNHQVLHFAISIQARGVPKRMASTHRDDEILFIEASRKEARRDVVGGNDRDVHRARLQLGESGAPGAVG